ncbi:MAG: tyrosine-type recombinase/integrase [Deltaproteobacteria bacterium]|nr:tyrosine-type recombinase/integrase [Deltaproteobacteria bacterium]
MTRALAGDVDTSLRVMCSDPGHHTLVAADGPIAEANEFLAALQVRGLSPRTIRAYAYDLLLLYRWMHAARRSLRQLEARDLLGFIAAQRKVGAEPKSINRRLTTARLLYRFWMNRELGVGSRVSLPSAHYKGPGRDHDLGIHRLRRRGVLKLRVREPRKLVEPLTPEQVRAFLRSLKRYRDLAITHFMLLCGLRSAEVLGLDLDDIIFSDGRVRVCGKGQRDRVLPLPLVLSRALRRYLELERPRQCSKPRLFVVLQGKRRGQPMTPTGLRSLFRHRRRRRVLATANPHRFRHTFGADMARAGVRLPVLQQMMGHADLKTTLQYVRLSMADVADEFRRALKKIAARYR